MQDTPQEILFRYLYRILYEPNHLPLDPETLPLDYRKLGHALLAVDDMVAEERNFALSLAKGNLSVTPPGVDNILAAPIKDLQASLRHLAWQTQQVAKGDYSQRVDFMGEFSVAFNAMTAQLEERYISLMAEKEKVEEKNADLRRSLKLVSALTQHTHNMTFVLAQADGRQLFANDSAVWTLQLYPTEGAVLCKMLAEHCPEQGQGRPWELKMEFPGKGGPTYYDVESFPLSWEGERAAVYVLSDQTERRQQEDLMYRLSYTDPLTGLNNRRYAMALMERRAAEKKPFLLSFIDVDYLKLCNDSFGHTAGDKYLIKMAEALKSLGGQLSRVGGDEFILLEEGTDAAAQNARLEELRRRLAENNTEEYPTSFSFATTSVPPGAEEGLEHYITETDALMYQYKRSRKPPLAGTYCDTRQE